MGQEQGSNRCDDVVRLESNVLDPGTPIIVHIFLKKRNKGGDRYRLSVTQICAP